MASTKQERVGRWWWNYYFWWKETLLEPFIWDLTSRITAY